MFPAINVASVRLKECRRVILFHLIDDHIEEPDQNSADNHSIERQTIEIRHYAIKATPAGVNKRVRRLIQTKVPNLSKVQDIADYIEGTATASMPVDVASDSEPEDGNTVVELAQSYVGRGNKSQSKSALKLVEIGPRLSLELYKVEQGLGDGNVMYHAHIKKSAEEVKAIQQKAEKKVLLKKQRREEQERNVERKRKAKEEKRDAKRKRKEEREQSELDQLRNNDEDGSGAESESDEDILDEDLGVSDIEDDQDSDHK